MKTHWTFTNFLRLNNSNHINNKYHLFNSCLLPQITSTATMQKWLSLIDSLIQQIFTGLQVLRPRLQKWLWHRPWWGEQSVYYKRCSCKLQTHAEEGDKPSGEVRDMFLEEEAPKLPQAAWAGESYCRNPSTRWLEGEWRHQEGKPREIMVANCMQGMRQGQEFGPTSWMAMPLSKVRPMWAYFEGMRKMMSSPSFYIWWNWGSKCLKTLPKVTLVVNGQVGIQAYSGCLQI